jgi:hypothetical protein
MLSPRLPNPSFSFHFLPRKSSDFNDLREGQARKHRGPATLLNSMIGTAAPPLNLAASDCANLTQNLAFPKQMSIPAARHG